MLRYGIFNTIDNFYGFRSQSSESEILTLDSLGVIQYDTLCLDVFLKEREAKIERDRQTALAAEKAQQVL